MALFNIDSLGWLADCRHIASPFFNQRPHSQKPTLLVVHNISLPPLQYGGPYIEQLFTGTLDPKAHPYFETISHLQVSAHCLIRRDGEVIQFVSFLDRAWHAGQSQFLAQENCNDFSIGIELEGSDFEPFTDVQYQVLSQLSHALIRTYPISDVTGHSDIAPQRKTDPGPYFDWSHYMATLPASMFRYALARRILNSIQIIQADYHNAQHADAIVTLLDAYATSEMGGNDPLTEDVKQRLVPTLAKMATAFSILAFHHGKPIGLVNCFWGFSTFACRPLVNVHDVYVEESFRGFSICQSMFDKVAIIARKGGACKLTLEVLQGNSSAQKSYKKSGFTPYELHTKTGNALFWEKKLP